MDSFVNRKIDLAIRLASSVGTNVPNKFAASGSDEITVSGLRTSVQIQNSGAAAGSMAQVSVWGLNRSVMNQLSTLGMVINMVPRNVLTVTAGDDASGMSTVFVGTILQAWGDYSGSPDVPFRFECQAGAAEAVIPYPATSYDGSTEVSVILSAIAGRMGWGFENSGVNERLASPYFSGSAMQQVRTVAEQANINASLINNTLCIWPRYAAREQGSIPLLSPPPVGQMVGYPSFTQQGILIKNIFDPRITFGGQVKVESSILLRDQLDRIQSEESLWNVYKMDLALEALLPGGQWMATIYGYNPRFPAPLPPQSGGQVRQ